MSSIKLSLRSAISVRFEVSDGEAEGVCDVFLAERQGHRAVADRSAFGEAPEHLDEQAGEPF